MVSINCFRCKKKKNTKNICQIVNLFFCSSKTVEEGVFCEWCPLHIESANWRTRFRGFQNWWLDRSRVKKSIIVHVPIATKLDNSRCTNSVMQSTSERGEQFTETRTVLVTWQSFYIGKLKGLNSRQTEIT